MRKAGLAVILLVTFLLPAACRSSKVSDTMPVQLIPPRFRVRQMPGQMTPGPYRNSTKIDLLIDIYNDSAEPITLRRIQLHSQVGNLKFSPAGRILTRKIPAHGVETVDIWVTASMDMPFGPQDEPMSVRGVATFSSEYGTFQRLFTQPVLTGDEATNPK